MSDAEALLWSVEQHPHLTSTMGALALLDGVPDPERLRSAVARLLVAVPRLRQKVVAPTSMAPPEWTADGAFDLDHHLRHVRLPAPGNMAQLRALAAQVIADPFDRSRPLWRMLIVSGLPGKRAAAILVLHHAVADGEGALQIAAHLIEMAPDEAPPAPVDLAEVFAEDARNERTGPLRSPVVSQLRRSASVAARLFNETANAMADPAAAYERRTRAFERARALADHVPGTERHVSPLWQKRSRNRRLELLNLPLQPALERARELGGSLNDLFVSAVLEGSISYHRHFDVELPQMTASMVVSTRTEDQSSTTNSFLPLTAVVPSSWDLSPVERFAAVRDLLTTKKETARQSPDLGSLAGLAGMLPAPLTTGVALDQVRRIDFATSNLRGLPVPVWLAGRSVTALYPVGPTLGTAFNVTLMSNLDQLHLGCNIDPVAVSDPPLLGRCIGDGFTALGVASVSREQVAR
jgi:WS/DGAT/MGAT family acyltransferase